MIKPIYFILVVYGFIPLIIFAGIWAILWSISFSFGLNSPLWTLATGLWAAIPVMFGPLTKGEDDE